MAKINVSCRFKKSAKDMADLIRYMATREGVEKLPSGQKYNLAKVRGSTDTCRERQKSW